MKNLRRGVGHIAKNDNKRNNRKALSLFKMGGVKRPPATSFSPVTEELSPKLFDC